MLGFNKTSKRRLIYFITASGNNNMTIGFPSIHPLCGYVGQDTGIGAACPQYTGFLPETENIFSIRPEK